VLLAAFSLVQAEKPSKAYLLNESAPFYNGGVVKLATTAVCKTATLAGLWVRIPPPPYPKTLIEIRFYPHIRLVAGWLDKAVNTANTVKTVNTVLHEKLTIILRLYTELCTKLWSILCLRNR
jgi:hypothetical protein